MKNKTPSEKLLQQLMKEISDIYDKAESTAKKQISEYLSHFCKEDVKKRKLLESGKISKQEYMNWRMKIAMGKKWQSFLEKLAKKLTVSDTIADDIIFQALAKAYKEGRYYGIYEVEHQTGVHTGAEKDVRMNSSSLPKRDKKKPERNFTRNKQMIHSNVVIMLKIYGTPISAITGDMKRVTSISQLYSNRNAYLLVTGAENAGRIDSYQEIHKLGIPLMKTWLCRGDFLTRESHQEINGQCVELGKTFDNGCRFPCDPRGELEEICNCRCKMIVTAEKFHYSQLKVDKRLKHMTYEQWRENLDL